MIDQATALVPAGGNLTSLTSLEPRSMLAACREMRSVLEVRLVSTPSGPKFRPGEMPTPQEVQAVAAATSRMRKFLEQRCSSDAVRKALESFTSAGMATPNSAHPASLVDAYSRVLDRFPPDIVTEAASRICNGTAGEEVSKKFFPTAPELALVCEKVRGRWALQVSSLELTIGYPEARRVVELPEAERRARSAQIAGLVTRAAEEVKP